MILLSILFSVDIAFPLQNDIHLEIFGDSGRPQRVVFFAPHEDEHVVNSYLAQKIKGVDGRFLILRQQGDRNIRFHLEQEIEVDPNRIFTDLGTRESLLKLNPNLLPDSALFQLAYRHARDLGKFIIDQMNLPPQDAVIVAIHNNTHGYDDDGKGGVGTISIDRYQKKFDDGARYIKDVFRGSGDEDDLFFITLPSDFEAVTRKGWNAVLQHPQVGTLAEEDDGSLSVYSEKNHIRYINIEAQRKDGNDHLEEQQKMVDLVFDLVFK